MLVPMRAILETADQFNYAQGSFNVNAVAQAKAAIAVHEQFRSPAILQGADLANAFMGGRPDFMNGTVEDKIKGAANIGAAVKRYGEAAIAGGYTSVMIDGSSLSFEDNVELTREVVKYAHPLGVTVEGELGVLAGVEDHVFSSTSTYTNPLKAVEFFKKTKCDALAISYGTMHGANKGKDTKIRKEIAIATKECMRHEGICGFLVSHGSSTVPQYIVEEINALGGDIRNAYGIALDQLVEVGHSGISKINVDTDIRLAVTRNMRELFAAEPALQDSASIGPVYQLLEANKQAFDPRAFLPPLMDTVIYGNVPDADVARIVDCIEQGVKEVVGTLIVQFGSYGKAPWVEQVTLEQMASRYKKEGI